MTSRLVWLLVCCLYKEVYLHIFKCVSFWLHGCCGEWEGGPVNQVNHTSWVAVVTLTDRPKSVHNCCLIELFCGVVCVVTLPFWHFCWCRGFCHRTGSDLLLFVFQTEIKLGCVFVVTYLTKQNVSFSERISNNRGKDGCRQQIGICRKCKLVSYDVLTLLTVTACTCTVQWMSYSAPVSFSQILNWWYA